MPSPRKPNLLRDQPPAHLPECDDLRSFPAAFASALQAIAVFLEQADHRLDFFRYAPPACFSVRIRLGDPGTIPRRKLFSRNLKEVIAPGAFFEMHDALPDERARPIVIPIALIVSSTFGVRDGRWKPGTTGGQSGNRRT